MQVASLVAALPVSHHRDMPEPPTTTTTVAPAPAPSPAPPPSRPAESRSVASQPAPEATGGPAPSGGCHGGWKGLSQPQHIARAHACWDGLLGQYAWPTARMFSVMMCESNGDPDDGNPSGAHGLMQDLNGPYDPAANMQVAFGKYQASGLHPWDASRSCWINASNG